MTLAKEIKIRKVTDDDLEDVFPMIDKENWYWTLPEVERLLKTNKTHSLVAVLNNEIAGILFVLKKGKFATWTHFIVKEKFRNAGIGKKLMNYNFDDLSKSGVDDIDIIAVANKVDFYKNFKFTKTEEILVYEKNTAAFKKNKLESVPNNCKVVSMNALEDSDALRILEKNTGCSLNKLTGGLVYDGVSPIVGYYEKNILKGIMLTHMVSIYIDFGPWLIEDITNEKAKEMLSFATDLVADKTISVCISSENKLAKELTESEGFNFTEKLVRMIRSDKLVSTLNENLISIGKF